MIGAAIACLGMIEPQFHAFVCTGKVIVTKNKTETWGQAKPVLTSVTFDFTEVYGRFGFLSITYSQNYK